jgi:hypothetical protein
MHFEVGKSIGLSSPRSLTRRPSSCVVEISEWFAYGGISWNLITYLTSPLGQFMASATAAINAWSGASTHGAGIAQSSAPPSSTSWYALLCSRGIVSSTSSILNEHQQSWLVYSDVILDVKH